MGRVEIWSWFRRQGSESFEWKYLFLLPHPSIIPSMCPWCQEAPHEARTSEGRKPGPLFFLLKWWLQWVGLAVPSWALASLPFLQLHFLPRTPFLSQHLHLPLLKPPSLLKATSQGRPLTCSGGQLPLFLPRCRGRASLRSQLLAPLPGSSHLLPCLLPWVLFAFEFSIVKGVIYSLWIATISCFLPLHFRNQMFIEYKKEWSRIF